MFHFSKFINLFFYVHSHFESFLNSGIYTPTRFYWLILVQCFMQFQACSIYVLSILIRSIFNSATSCLSKFARVVLYSYAIAIFHLLILILVPFLVSFNVYAAPSFFQLCSLLAFFPHTCYTFNSSLTT